MIWKKFWKSRINKNKFKVLNASAVRRRINVEKLIEEKALEGKILLSAIE